MRELTTLDEAIQAKRLLEDSLLDSLREFTERTGLCISVIRLDHLREHTVGSRPVVKVSGVKLEVGLP